MTIELCVPVHLVEISTTGHIVDLPKGSFVFSLGRKQESKEYERHGIRERERESVASSFPGPFPAKIWTRPERVSACVYSCLMPLFLLKNYSLNHSHTFFMNVRGITLTNEILVNNNWWVWSYLDGGQGFDHGPY